MRSVSLWLVHIQHGMSASPVVFSASVHMFWAPQDLPFSVPMLSATCPCGLRGSKGRCSCQGQEGDQSGGQEWCLRQAAHCQPLTLANIQHTKNSPSVSFTAAFEDAWKNYILQNLDLEPGSVGQFPISKQVPGHSTPWGPLLSAQAKKVGTATTTKKKKVDTIYPLSPFPAS